jgi:hypothetical protein
MNMMHAIDWLKSAWDNVSKSTIVKCFHRAGIDHDMLGTEEPSSQIHDAIEDSLDDMLRDLEIDHAVLDEHLSTNATHDWESEILSPPEQEVKNDEASGASEDEMLKQPGMKPHKLWPSCDEGAPTRSHCPPV